MKFFFLILLVVFSPLATAERKLNKEVFQANVRPVLSGIINDYYQMISLFPYFPRELIKIIELMEKVTVGKEYIYIACSSFLNIKCLKEIETLQAQLSEVEASLLKLNSSIEPTHSPYLNTLGGIRLLGEFKLKISSIKGTLWNSSLLIRAQISNKKNTLQIIKELDEAKTFLSLAIVEFFPFTYKEDFRQFYFNFIHPIELHVAKNKNYEFLNQNVESLNFFLNLFNVGLTKRNKKTPDNMGPLLNLIHNRWNNILRYYM